MRKIIFCFAFCIALSSQMFDVAKGQGKVSLPSDSSPVPSSGILPIAPAVPPPTYEDARKRASTVYSRESLGLSIGVVVLGFLMFFMLTWYSARLDRASYLGQLYRDTVEDVEYRRLAASLREKFDRWEYHGDVQFDSEWVARNPEPEVVGSYYGPPGSGPPGSGRGTPGVDMSLPPPPGFAGTSPSEEDRVKWEAQRVERERKRVARVEWEGKVNREAQLRYRKDLSDARKKAQDSAVRAADVDLGVLRGRGAEFVLDFTAILVIVGAAVLLGIIGVLGSEQIGTLLAAIAGYVLGRSATRSQTASTSGGSAPTDRKQPAHVQDNKPPP